MCVCVADGTYVRIVQKRALPGTHGLYQQIIMAV